MAIVSREPPDPEASGDSSLEPAGDQEPDGPPVPDNQAALLAELEELLAEAVDLRRRVTENARHLKDGQ